MPVPVSMIGTVAFSTQERIKPAPPLGMSRSTSPLAHISSVALWRVVSSTRHSASWGRPAAVRPSCNASTMAAAERWASFPPRRTQADPAFRARAAASLVTLGRLS